MLHIQKSKGFSILTNTVNPISEINILLQAFFEIIWAFVSLDYFLSENLARKLSAFAGIATNI